MLLVDVCRDVAASLCGGGLVFCADLPRSAQQAVCPTFCFKRTWPRDNHISTAGMAAQCSKGYSGSAYEELATTSTCCVFHGFVCVVRIHFQTNAKKERAIRTKMAMHNKYRFRPHLMATWKQT